MFAALRNGLGRATQGMRARGTVGLFVFEFFVVVLGVLAAQGVQEWAKQRDQQRHAEEELARLSIEYVRAQRAAEGWRVAIPCLRARVEDLMRAAAAGTPVEPNEIKRPRMIGTAYVGTGPDMVARIRKILGETKTVALMDVQTRAVDMDDSMKEMRARWEKFRLLDPGYGAVSDADRSIAREAGADILMHMRNLEIAIINIDEARPNFTADANVPLVLGVDVLPVSSCAQLWADGTAFRSLE